jgi:protein-disulfide isomerase
MAQTVSSSRQRIPIWLLIPLLAAGAVLCGVLVYRLMPMDAPIPDEALTRYIGLEQGYTDQGFPRLGRADAPTVVEEFSSFACPYCRAFHDEHFVKLLSAIAAGKVQFVFIPISTIGWGAESAAKGALCAGEQDHFWEMHDALFDWQDRLWAFNGRRIKTGAKNLGLDTTAFNHCMDSVRPKAVLERAHDEFERRKLTGTPTLFINGWRVTDYREIDALSE